MSTPTASEVVRCILRDGFSFKDGAAYCRRIAQAAHFNPYADMGMEHSYLEAANILEAREKAEKLSLDYVERLEAEIRSLTAHVIELQKTIISLQTR